MYRTLFTTLIALLLLGSANGQSPTESIDTPEKVIELIELKDGSGVAPQVLEARKESYTTIAKKAGPLLKDPANRAWFVESFRTALKKDNLERATTEGYKKAASIATRSMETIISKGLTKSDSEKAASELPGQYQKYGKRIMEELASSDRILVYQQLAPKWLREGLDVVPADRPEVANMLLASYLVSEFNVAGNTLKGDCSEQLTNLFFYGDVVRQREKLSRSPEAEGARAIPEMTQKTLLFTKTDVDMLKMLGPPFVSYLGYVDEPWVPGELMQMNGMEIDEREYYILEDPSLLLAVSERFPLEFSDQGE